MNDQQEKGAIGAVIEGNVTPVVVVPESKPATPGEGGTTVIVNPPAPAPAPAPAEPSPTLP